MARIKQNGKYGFIDKTGKIVIPFIYRNASNFEKGLSEVQINATGNSDHIKEAVIDTSGKIVWIGNDRNFYDDGEGLQYTSLAGKYGFVDKLGNVVLPFIYEYKNIGEREGPYGFSEGLACVALNDKFGFVDKKGNLLIPCIYDDAQPFSEGLAAVKKNDKWGFIDKNGRESCATVMQHIY